MNDPCMLLVDPREWRGGAMIILWLCYFYFSAEPQDYKGFYAVSRVRNIFLTLRYHPMMSYVIL